MTNDKISPITSQTKKHEKKIMFIYPIAEFLLRYQPDLKNKLYLANSPDSAIQFLQKIVITTIYISLGFCVLVALLLHILHINVLFAPLLLPFILIGVFSYFMLYPDIKIIKRRKEIDNGIVFAGRHLLIGLRAGIPLFDALVGVSSGYGAVSEEFRRIVDKINMGVPMAQALREAENTLPNSPFSRVIMQIANAISSGAEVAHSLETVLDQITKEQMIELKAYGRKLNPLIMFFMIFGIIFPSLGVAFAVILFSLVSGGMIGLSSVSLLYVTAIIVIVQFIFLTVVESSRPNVIL